MKSLIVSLSLFLLSIQIEAQREGCPEFCPAVYMPVCGETFIDGKAVKCEFGNGCVMGVSSCQNRLNWSQVPLEKCRQPSPICTRLH